MNRKQLTSLLMVGALVVALGWMLSRSKDNSYQAANQRLGQKVIANFPLNDVDAVTIKQPLGQQVNLARTADGWVVKERSGYAANFNNISDLLRKVWELKVAQTVKISPARLARVELTPPDNSTNSGTVVEFKDKTGKVLSTLTLGKKTMRESPGGESPMGMGMGGGAWPNGRFIMVGTDAKTVAIVSEPFSNVEAKPAEWIDKEFFKVEKQKTIAVSSATNSWKLSRDSETNEWKLADLKPGEQLDTTKSSSVTSALSWPSFTDVAANADPAQTGLDKPQVTANIETLDGFTYDLKVGKKAAEDKDDYYVQVAADAKLVKERAPGKDEKPEDKARLDKEFKEKVDKLADKLKNEKALAKWAYLVPKYTLEPLFKDRKELLVEKKEEPKKEDISQAEPPKAEPAIAPPAVKVEPAPPVVKPAPPVVKPAPPKVPTPAPPPPPMPPKPDAVKPEAPKPVPAPAAPATNAPAKTEPSPVGK